MKLDGVEFLRRFLMHILPSGFMSIRHFGFLANCVRQLRLTPLRELLKLSGMVLKRALKPVFSVDKLTYHCPSYGQGQMQIVTHLLSLKERRRLKLSAI